MSFLARRDALTTEFHPLWIAKSTARTAHRRNLRDLASTCSTMKRRKKESVQYYAPAAIAYEVCSLPHTNARNSRSASVGTVLR